MLNIHNIPLDDKKTYELLQRGETRGVFQIDGQGITNVLVRLRPDRFSDISAVLALFRPGPIDSGLVDDYINIKHGHKKAEYVHPIMKDILEETYSVMVFQEQVMQILNRLAGMPLSDSYTCIKMISKKKPDKVAKYKDQFVSGAVKNKVSKDIAEHIFQQIEYFAGYSFNKSHATAYAHLAYQTAYLKAHYPCEFMTSLLSSEMEGSEREKYLIHHLHDARRLGFKILPPSINDSEFKFISVDQSIRFGLGAIKGVTSEAVSAIVTARGNQAFTSLGDFAGRIDHSVVSKKCTEALVKAGAFDWCDDRSKLLGCLDKAYKEGKNQQKDIRNGQFSLFDIAQAPQGLSESADYKRTDRTSDEEFKILEQEMSVLGFAITAHPISPYVDKIRALSNYTIDDIYSLNGSLKDLQVILGGWAGGIYLKNLGGRGDGPSQMGRFILDDDTGQISCIAWPEAWKGIKKDIGEGGLGFVLGKAQKRGNEICIIVSDYIKFKDSDRLVRGLSIKLDYLGESHEHILHSLAAIVRGNPGNLPIYLDIGMSSKRVVLRAGEKFNVNLSDRLIQNIQNLCGEGSVSLIGNRQRLNA